MITRLLQLVRKWVPVNRFNHTSCVDVVCSLFNCRPKSVPQFPIIECAFLFSIPRAHEAKFYGRLRLIRSVWRASVLKWCIHLSRSLFYYFNYLVSVTAGGPWVPEDTCSQVLRSTSVDSWRLRASKFPVLKLMEIVILWVYYTIPFGLSLVLALSDNYFNFWNNFVLLRITDEGSLPEMSIWSILLI